LRLGQILKDIFIPDDVLARLQASLERDRVRSRVGLQKERERLEQRQKTIRLHLDASDVVAGDVMGWFIGRYI
jgi:hypothetical protein